LYSYVLRMYSHVLRMYSNKNLKSTVYSNCTHMREGQKRINVYLPEDLYARVLRSEYKDMTEAVIQGLTNLLETQGEDFKSTSDTNTQDSFNPLQEELIRSLRDHITSLESQIMVKDEQLRTQAVHLQTVLTQKYIAPPKKEKPAYEKKESRPAQKNNAELSDINAELSEKEKNIKEVTCLNCGKVFTAARSTRMYCSGACKEAYRRKLKKESQ